MIALGPMRSYGIGGTRLISAERFAKKGNLLAKLEGDNACGSIKDRTAYYIFEDLLRSGRLVPGSRIVESTSGNFGVSLRLFAREYNIEVLCIVDPTMGHAKLARLLSAGAVVESVSSPDGNNRIARVHRARELDGNAGFVWCNQYGNSANVAAHEMTTGREIWDQTDGTVSVVVCAVGTGGTICGVGRALKARAASIEVVGVEPVGSTIFGGVFEPYLNVGAGLPSPSQILWRFGDVIDKYAKVPDALSIATALRFADAEGIGVGVTSGMVLAVAERIAEMRPSDIVVAIAPDGATYYQDELETRAKLHGCSPELCDAKVWHAALQAGATGPDPCWR
jgi:cysteine synthase